VAEAPGRTEEPERRRRTIRIDGPDPRAGWDRVGGQLRTGGTGIAVKGPIGRCLHGAANPIAGACDAGAPGRRDRGVCHGELGLDAAVLSGGTGHGGAGVELL
jgi:hypothetical protein